MGVFHISSFLSGQSLYDTSERRVLMHDALADSLRVLYTSPETLRTWGTHNSIAILRRWLPAHTSCVASWS